MRADAPDLNPVDRRQSGDAFAAVFCPRSPDGASGGVGRGGSPMGP